MKAKITLLIGAVALVTLSFTFATVEKPNSQDKQVATSTQSAPVGGLFADEVVE